MVAVAWAAIGLLGATLAVLTAALFQLRAEFRQEFSALRGEMREGFRAQGARIDAQGDSLGARIDRLNERFDDHLGRHVG